MKIKTRKEILSKLAALGYGDGYHSNNMMVIRGALKLMFPVILILIAIGAMIFMFIFMANQ